MFGAGNDGGGVSHPQHISFCGYSGAAGTCSRDRLPIVVTEVVAQMFITNFTIEN